MDKTLQHLDEQLIGIRWGIITSGLLDSIKISYYGGTSELRYIAISTGNSKRIEVTPYDSSLLPTINLALNNAGFNSYVFSKRSIVVTVPQPSGEEKEKVIKTIKKLGEEAKISIRNIRKEARKELDDKEVQKMTDFFIREIDELIENKVKSM